MYYECLDFCQPLSLLRRAACDVRDSPLSRPPAVAPSLSAATAPNFLFSIQFPPSLRYVSNRRRRIIPFPFLSFHRHLLFIKRIKMRQIRLCSFECIILVRKWSRCLVTRRWLPVTRGLSRWRVSPELDHRLQILTRRIGESNILDLWKPRTQSQNQICLPKRERFDLHETVSHWLLVSSESSITLS